MGRIISIQAGSVTVLAELNNSSTAEKIWNALPIEGRANTWGDEIYFRIPLSLPPENPQETVEMGDLGYWPTGEAFCIFFGPTPASRGVEIRPAGPVNVCGRVSQDPTVLKKVAPGDPVVIKKGG
ncbi:MAG: hypothetical protein XD69_1041 [Clostridia bacterium 62_21]|nr:MAG: hypothetical protein XD69_1041 [Clostridia bacterium 62_21]